MVLLNVNTLHHLNFQLKKALSIIIKSILITNMFNYTRYLEPELCKKVDEN